MNTTANHTKRLIPMAAAMLLTMGLAGCADEGGLGGDSGGNTTSGGTTTSGTTGGGTTTAGTTGGGMTTGGTTTTGTTGGMTTGGTTTTGTTGGMTTGGTTTGGMTTGGTTTGGDTTGGTTTGGSTTGGTSTGGTTGGPVAGIICNPTSTTFQPIQSPDASVTTQVNGICVGCSVSTPENVIDADPATVASLSTPIGLLTGSSQLNVIDTLETYPAGRRAGFTLFDPAGALLTLNLLQSVRLSVALNGNEVDSAVVPTGVALDLLGTPVIGTTEPQFLSFVPTADFNEVRISFGGNLANLLAQIGIIQACVSVNPAILP